MSDAAQPKAPPAPEAAAGGGKQKRLAALLIPAVAGLAIGAGGATGWFVFASQGAPAAEESAEHGGGESAEGEAESAAEGDTGHGAAAAAEHAEDPHSEDAHAASEHGDAEPAAADHGADQGKSEHADSGHGGSGKTSGRSHGGGGGHGETPDANGKGPLWSLDPIVTNLVNDGTPMLLKLRLELGFASEQAREQAMGSDSAVRDAVLTLVSSRRVADLTSFEGKVLLKEDIRMRLDHVLDGPQVESVLVTEFVIQ